MNQLYVFKGNEASRVSQHDYESEKILQDIVATNPQLLVESQSPNKKLFLVKQEFSLPESIGSTNSYSLDHLMVSNDGVPALVEIKRCSDNRAKREVVAQMLDYASRMALVNAQDLREFFQQSNADEYDTDEFWEKVATNLKAERMELYFVADSIPENLITIMDFMRRTMNGIAVYGVEIKQYESAGTTLLSSAIMGGYQPEPIKLEAGFQWDAPSYLGQMARFHDKELEETVTDIQNACTELGYKIMFGRGAKQPTFRGVVNGATIFDVVILNAKLSIQICLPTIQRILKQDSPQGLLDLFGTFSEDENSGKIYNDTALHYNLSFFKDNARRNMLFEKLGNIQKQLVGNTNK